MFKEESNIASEKITERGVEKKRKTRYKYLFDYERVVQIKG